MLELDGLTRRYGDLVALDDLSFSVAPGRLCGFVGPNGAGKTTAMRIVLGVLEPDAGRVRWHGAPVDAATRARFGYMPEERGLYPKMRVRAQSSTSHGCTGSPRATPRPRPTAGSSGSGWRSAPATASRRSRSATGSACSSGSRSCTTPRCSCSTSRSPAWGRSGSCSSWCSRCSAWPSRGWGGALDVDGDMLVAAGLALVWFVVGYAFYAAAFACAASLVSRQEDLQSVLMPLTLVLMVGFFLSFGAASDPDGELARVASFIPPIAPMTMPPRIALGEAGALDVVAALAVTLGATALLIPLAARIYSGAVLRTGGTIRLRDAWRAARA